MGGRIDVAGTAELGAALVLSFLHLKDWKSKGRGKMTGPVYLKKAKPLGRLLRDRPSLLNKLRRRFRRRLTPGEIQRREQQAHSADKKSDERTSIDRPLNHAVAYRAKLEIDRSVGIFLQHAIEIFG